MSEARRIIEVDGFDHRLMVKGLSEFRNELIEKQLPTEDVNKLLLKVIDAPEKSEVRQARHEAR